jgi:hypothetical protein
MIKRKLRMTAPQINRMRSLLHMWYSPSELAGEIGVQVEWIKKKCIPAGCPHRQDDGGHIWIDGTSFVAWAMRECRPKPQKMEPGKVWCLRCKGPVDMVGPFNVLPMPSNRNLEIVQGKCAVCGRVVSLARKAIPK